MPMYKTGTVPNVITIIAERSQTREQLSTATSRLRRA